jgi:hypothetical protein
MNIMYRGNKIRIVPILIIVIIAALVIAALVSLGRVFFTGSGTSDNVISESQQIRDDTINTAIGRAVRFTERGPIVADENFRSYQIVVSPTDRTYTTYSGYLSRVVTSKTYQNNSRAYEELVHALDMAEISKLQNANTSDDFRGVCATNGRLYVYETTNNDAVTHTLWTSTCAGSKGNLGANVAQVKALFVNQIPDFDAGYIGSTNRQ